MNYYLKGQINASSVLSKKARDAHVFKDTHSKSLTYLGELCEDEFTYILDKKRIRVVKVTHSFLSMKRNQMDGFGTHL